MMKVCLGFASIVLASSAAFAQQAEPAPGAAGTTRGVASAVRFATTVELPAPGGQAQTYRLALGDIKVSGSKRVQVPPSGFYVATLVTNDVISVEGDQRVLRHTGDSWAVPAGQPLVLEPQGKNHTVLLEVFRVEPSPAR
jgi:hypothetical protein